MKYNIMTVANENYKKFIKLFINSLFELYDMADVNKVYVYDTGLSKETIEYLQDFPKIEVVKTSIISVSNKIHDEGWKTSTYSKTKFLLEILIQDELPTFMIDSDCIFVSNFQHLVDWDSDVVACDRNREGFSKHIGSFFGAINVENSKEFLVKWIDNLEYLQNNTDMKHCESPALSKTIKENSYNVQELPEQVVSAVFPDQTSLIFHLKSDYYAKTVEERISLPHAINFVKRYL